VRISAGLLKGRKTGSGKMSSKMERDEGFRPTSSKVREAIFNILQNDIEGAAFLDLYAGSGTVGFEALSRGAARCCFVEKNPRRIEEIVSSVKRMLLDDRVVVFREKASDFLRRVSKSGTTFRIIFADPPYSSEEISEIFPLLDAGGFLEQGGILMVEHSSKKVLGDTGRTLRLIKNYKYGDTMLTLFRKGL
jgi:16S rRNA (guanine966-N2)-methyltransferase